MDIKRKVVDVSSFLLFEATGDSEAGCFDPALSAAAKDDDDDDDDAESCSSSDLLPAGTVMELKYSLDEKLSANDGYDDHDHYEDEEDGEVVDQIKEVHFYKKCRDDHQRSIINGSVVAKETSVSVDSTKTMNETEKSRLFWEACLAS